MVIKLQQENSRTRVVIGCDVCSEPIEDVTLALVRFARLEEGASSSELLYCHKGNCDASLKATRPLDQWMELRHFLVRTSIGCGLTTAVLLSVVDELKDLSKLD